MDNISKLYADVSKKINIGTENQVRGLLSTKEGADKFYNVMTKEYGVDLGNHTDYMVGLGYENLVEAKDAPPVGVNTEWNADVDLATSAAKEAKYQADLAKNKLEWTQKQKPFGGSKPFGRVDLGMNDKVVKSDDGQWLTESGRTYDNFTEANLDQNLTDQHNSQSYRLTRMEEQLGEMKDRSGELLKESKKEDEKQFSQALGMGPYYGSMMRHESPNTTAIRKAQADLDDAQEALNELYRQRAEGGETNYIKNSVDFWKNLGSGNIKDAAKNLVDAGNDGLTTLKRVGRGFSDTAGDLSNWDFGVTDATHEGILLSAILKRDNGQPLTKQEQFMLDSAALRAGVTNEVGDLGLAYTSGNVTAASLPFMIEMMANPLSGLGKGATKALTKYVVKKYGKEAVKNNMKKYLATKAVSRVSGDIAGSLGMTATSGFAGTAANAAERQIGSVQTAYDENGNIVYGGHVGGEDALTAWTKGVADRTIENWSEMSGAYFAALGAPIKAVIGKGIGRIIPEKMLQSDFAQWATKKYGDLKNSKFYKGVDAVKSRAQIGGLFEEYLEEKYGDLMRLSIGDTTFDTNSETGIFNLERNVETLVSLIPTQVGFGMLRLGGARTANYQYRQQRKAADKYLDGVLGENWKALRMQLDAAQHDPTAIAQIYSNMNQIGGNIPINVRRAVMNYINAQQSVLHSDPALYQSRTDRVDIQEQDGKFVASDKDAMGNVLGNKTFETREEADAYATNRMEETRDDDMHRFMQTARGLNMVDYNQTAEQFMQERGFDNMTAEEQAEFLDEMSSGRGKTGKAWIEFKTKTIENNMSGANFAISSWEQAHGLEPGTIEDILDRQPTERTIEENDILSEAYGMLHDLAYPQGKAHVEQSKLDGIKLADEANLDAVMDVNEEGASEAKPDLAELAQLKLERETSHNIALNTLRSDTDMLTVFGEVMGNNGADAETVIQTLASMDEETLQNTLVDVMNEGVHTEKFQSVVDAVNAQAKYNAFIQRTGEKIDEKVERESNRRVFKGTLNGAQYTDKPTIITATDGEHTYQIVNSTEDITTDKDGNVTSQGVFTAIDENGNVAVFKGSPALHIDAEEELPTFAETMRQGLQEAVSEVIEPTTEEEVAAENTEGAVAETQSQPTENAGAADAAAMPQPTENTENAITAAAEPQTASEEVQEEGKPSYTKSKMVYDEKGNEAFDRMPIADTLEELLDGQLEDSQVEELIDNNIEAYEKEVAKLNEKKPKKTTSKSELIAATNKLKADRAEAERKLKYWQDVKAELAKITHTTEEEMNALSEAENPSDAELGIAGGTGAVGGATDTMPVDAVAMASGFLGNNAVKITPESFRAETGFGTKEQRGFVGMFAGKAKGGKTINEIAEALVEYDNAYYGGNYFKGDSQEARNAVIGAFSQARTKADLRANAVSNRDTLLSEWKQKRDDYYYEEFGMSYDDYMAYEGEILKDDIRREAGVDTAAMFADADEAREETVEETESQPAENTTEEEGETEAMPQSTTASKPATPTDAKEPFRERAREWSKKTGVDVVLLESIDDVESEYVRGQIIEAEKRNQQVKGWYSQNTGKVFIYMPHAESKEDIETTFIHEVVSHKGLKEMLGDKAFDALCDNVFEMMTPDTQAKFLDYVGAKDINNPTEAEKRAAADEYIAHLAEKTDLTDAEKSIWDNIVKMIRTALETLGLSISITDDVLSNLIKASYAEMVKNSRSEESIDENEGSEKEGARFSVKKNNKDNETENKSLSLQNKNKESNEIRNEETSKRDNDEQRQTDSRRVANDATRSLERNRDRSNIRMLEEGLATSLSEYSEYSERVRHTRESERLVNIAKKKGLFIPIQETKGLGVKNPKRTGESTVYINEENGKVYKVKDPYAKSAMKSGVQPEDVVYEHLVHNHLFPETAYTLEGVSEELGDVRIVLSQDLINSVGKPTREQITEELAKRGLYPEDNYSFGNELVSVTDVEGDNVLLGDDGTIYFIDPIINFKKPLREIIKGNDDIRFRIANDNQEIFVSNAEQAVKGIKQEKATPQQWKAMIQSKGGLKAGEDKWLGLSEWLDEQATAKRSLTKQEVLDFIGENKIRIEEVEYSDASSNDAFTSLKEEYDQWLREGGYDYAWEQLTDRYGDDAEIAFMDLAGELTIGNEEAAAALLGENVINSTRLDYTTEGLQNKREIALTVPTIESWNESDDIHFGDAGQGRAVAWVRFGETITYETIDDVQEVTEFHKPYENLNRHDVYKPVGSFKSGDYVVHGKGRDGSMIYVVYINDKQLPVAHTTLEEARNAMNEYYREHPRKLRKAQNILVIDEIQSKRHQEGREQGYAPKKTVTKDMLRDARAKEHQMRTALEEKYGKPFDGELPVSERAEARRQWVANLSEEDRNAWMNQRELVENYLTRLDEQSVGIPDAPFDKNWHELAMKRMLRLAAEEGFDKVAWTKGEQQADRYQLSAVVDHISYFENEDGTLDARAYSPYGGYQPIGKTWEEVERYVGKDIAKKMQEGVSESTENLTWGMGRDGNNIVKEYKTISGDNLKVGGEGMKGFYDKMLPSFMNKYGKKWGVKVEEVELPEVEEAGRTMWSVDVTPEMKESVMEGQVMFRVKKTFEAGSEYDVDKRANKYFEARGLVTGEYQTPHQLLEAVRNKHEEYAWKMDDDATKIECLGRWNELLPKTKKNGRNDKNHNERIAKKTERAKAMIGDVAKMLGLDVEVLEDTDNLTGKKKTAKGWYDVTTGKITVVLPNHTSNADVMATLLHEGVAHHGLRKMFGKDFDAMLDNVYEMSWAQNEINALAGENASKEQIREATEEYLARLAEDINFEKATEQKWWDYIKEAFVSMLRKAGITIGVSLTDNELRYLLWRSYQNLKETSEQRTALETMNDYKMQKKLGVYDGTGRIEPAAGVAEDIRFRFIGEQGAANLDKAEEATTRLDNLNVAREMEEAGKDAKSIKMATGWERGADKKWRYEVDDDIKIDLSANVDFRRRHPEYARYEELKNKELAAVLELGEPMTEEEHKEYDFAKTIFGGDTELHRSRKLKDYVESESLFKNYPELAAYSLNIVDEMEDGASGSFNPDTKAVTLKMSFKVGEMEKVLVHELQHAIQHIEGFAEGGNTHSSANKIAEVMNVIGAPNRLPFNNLVSYLENGMETNQQHKQLLAIAEANGYDDIVDYVESLNPYGYYHRLSGEVEARNAAERMGMTAEERRASLAAETEDVAREDQIFIFDGLESAAMPQRTMFRMADAKSQYDEKVDGLNKGIEEKGLRGHLGEVPYKKMMRTVYEGNDEIAQNASAMLQDNDWNLYDSIETYLADEAQTMGNEEMWQDVRQSLADAVDFFPSIKDTKYAMWLNKNRDNDPSDPNDGIKRNALLYKLEREEREAPVRFRTTPTPVADQAARAQYEKALKQLGYRWSEQWIDGTRSVAELQKAMFGKNFHLADSRDAHEAEKAMTSKIMQKQRQYHKHLVEPLGKAIEACMKDMLGKSRKERYENLKKYMYALHALERNRYIHVRDIVEDEHQLEDYVQYCIQQRQELDRGNITLLTYFAYLDGYIRQNIDKDFDADKIDKSGLRDEFPTDTEALSYYILVTEDRLKKERVNELWRRVRDVNDFALETEYQSGLISGELKAKVASMYGWYIPLRGFEEMTAEEEYDYNNTEVRAVGGPTLMGARGRKSKADDPIATMLSIGSQAIHRAERNEVKKKFYRAAKDYMKQNGQGGLVSELFVWEAKVGTDNQGNDIYEVQFPDITEDMSADEVAEEIADFEAKMKDKADKGEARQVRQGMNLNKAFEHKKSLEEHIVRVYENGQVHVLYLNGNPRAAQSLNGTLKFNTGIWGSKFFRKLQRAISQMMTSLNPTFALVANPIRDYQTALMNTLINDGILAGGWFMVEHFKSFWGMPVYARMFKLYEKGKLDMSKEEHRLFKEFADNGGITGFIESSAIEDYKSMMDGMLRTKTWPTITRFLDKSSEFLSTGNTLMENMARFATYKAARNRGLSIQKSVKRAKDYSLNFNQRGLANPKDGLAGALAYAFNLAYLFVNPTMQAFGMMVNNFKNHPAKTTFYQFAVPPMMASMIVPVLNIILASLLDDDDDDDIRDIYGTMPEWVRRNNICIYRGNGKWVMIPLPIELRAFYGIGETLVSELWGDTEMGKAFGWDKMKSDRPAEWQIFDLLMTLTPTSIVYSGGGIEDLEDAFVMTLPQVLKPIGELVINKKWTGAPIWNDSDYIKHNPEWQKAYSNTNPYIVEFCRWLNKATGGDDVRPNEDASWGNINPAKIDHIIQGYFGGFYKTLSDVGAIGKLIVSGNADAIRADQVPGLKAIWYNYDEAQQAKRYNALYYKYKEEAEETKAWERGYTDRGDIDGLLKLMAEPRYKRREIINDYETERQKFSAGIRKSHAREDEDTEEVFKRIRMLSDKAIVEELDKIK